jgi:hypothetical protein
MQDNDLDDREFTDEDLRAALKRVGQQAREAAFAAGRPVFVIKGNSLVAVHPDGTEEIVESLPPKSDGQLRHQ